MMRCASVSPTLMSLRTPLINSLKTTASLQQRRLFVAEALMPGGGILVRAASGLHNAWEYITARREWQKRSFLRRVNLSLCRITAVQTSVRGVAEAWGHAATTEGAVAAAGNTTDRAPADGEKYSLSIRTLFEKDISEIFLRNRALVGHVLDEAAKTKEGTPFLSLPAEDSWYMLTAILNEISSMFAYGHVLAAHGQARDEPYWFGITREAYTQHKSPRFEKLRILLIHENELKSYEKFTHDKRISRGLFSDRWRTLDAMHRLYKEHLASEGQYQNKPLPVHFHHKIMRISIPVPLGAAPHIGGTLEQ